ncbi:MAG TPA: NapC/NirT family cytochrome c [Verrucomicrobiae bacterium]|nr:NapC/NirT family cytochrome c [Verrucomicrobiae bacterium]
MNGPRTPKPKRSTQYRNWVSLSGFVVAISSFFAFVLLFAMDLFAHHGNPYMGILTYLVAPGFLGFGFFMILLGAWLHRRELRKLVPGAPQVFTIDFSRPRDRKALVGFLIGAVIFLLVTALGSYNTYHYTESVTFCGEACHTPMKPEFTAYQNSAHARVACSECHVGPGATWYVKSKINGVNQLYCTMVGDYHRPIKTPVKNLRPAQETCEQCHWPQRYIGQLDRTYAHFLSDDTNTLFSVRLLLNVGGGDPSHGPPGGIHWHMNVANKIEYIAIDEQRQVIPWVRVTGRDGKVTEFRTKDFKANPAKHIIRTMDCMDCHNRPAHNFQAPDDAVDLAITLKKIDASLPWVKSNAVAVLIQNYSTENEALNKIAAMLRCAYEKNAKPGQLDSLVAAVQTIYSQNFFPEMKADWRAYPNNIGHKNWPGCFRCHDGLHKAADGKTKIMASDCNSCHIILAQGSSAADLQKLSAKGCNFFHLDGEMDDFSCNNCHTGAFVK